jgi:serine/threonine-protein phosphatase 2A activator
MLKMYRAEVLGKLPVIQHFLFGSILPWDGPSAPTPANGEDACGHAHIHGDKSIAGQREMGWGDCCGIPVPSAFGAAQAEQNKGSRLTGPNIRPVPFD